MPYADKDKNAASKKKWYLNNRDSQMQKSRDRYAANKLKVKEENHKRYIKNRPHIRESQKQYYIDNRDALLNHVKESHKKNPNPGRIRSKEWNRSNPEKRKKILHTYYEGNKEKIKINNILYIERTGMTVKDYTRDKSLKRMYGMTLTDYKNMLSDQGGVCAVCGNPPEGERNLQNGKKTPRVLHVDHDHVTGLVRFLLCSTCNTGIGGLRDNPALLRKAADLIDMHNMKVLKNAKTK